MRGYAQLGGGKVGWKEMNRPKVGPLDAIIRPTAVSPCTTDNHLAATGAMPHLDGLAMGHEGVGIIDEIGSGVKHFKVGDLVAIPSVHPEWRSIEAQQGIAKQHDRDHYYSTEWPDKGGVFAEYFHVYDIDMNGGAIPEGVSSLQAVLLTDMATTAFAGVDALHVNYGDTIVVVGIGPVGLMGINAAYLRGAARIIGVGSRPACMEVARQYGVTEFVNYKDGDIADQVLELTGGERVDGVFITGGSTESFNTGLRMVRKGGVVSSVASFYHDEQVVIQNPVWEYGVDDKTITVVKAYGGRVIMERLLKLVQYGRLKPELMASHVLHGFDKIEDAFNLMGNKTPDLVKPVVLMDE